MTISQKLKDPVMVAPAPPEPTLNGHQSVRTFTTLGGLYYVFDFGGRERICHESNSLLRRAP